MEQQEPKFDAESMEIEARGATEFVNVEPGIYKARCIALEAMPPVSMAPVSRSSL